MSYGDMLNAILNILFPYNPKPRHAYVKEVICAYNPNVPRVARELFEFLRAMGADGEVLEQLRKELEESLRFDRITGCVAIYK